MGARVVTPVWNGVFTSVGGWLGLCGEYGDMGWGARSRVLEGLVGKVYNGNMSKDSLDMSSDFLPNC